MMRGRRSYIHRRVDVRRTEGRRLHVIMDPSTPDSDSDLPFVRASTIWLIIPSPYSLIPIIWNKNCDDGDDYDYDDDAYLGDYPISALSDPRDLEVDFECK